MDLRRALAALVMAPTLACAATPAAPATGATPPAEPAPASAADPPAPASDPSPAATPSAVDRSTPTAVAAAYLTAAEAGKLDDMLALMVPECAEKEKVWERGFTKNVAEGKIRLKSHEMREPE